MQFDLACDLFVKTRFCCLNKKVWIVVRWTSQPLSTPPFFAFMRHHKHPDKSYKSDFMNRCYPNSTSSFPSRFMYPLPHLFASAFRTCTFPLMPIMCLRLY